MSNENRNRQKKVGEYPINSSIFIDYRDKPNIRFEYPEKNIQLKDVKETSLVYIINLIFSLMLIIIGKTYSSDSNLLIVMLVIVFLFFFVNKYLIALFFKKTKIGQKIYPLLNKILLDKNFNAVFTSKHVKNKQVEIPLFNNIYMNYEADEEFSKYLERVEITPHDFNFNVRKGKEIKSVYHWKAVFYFTEAPTTGQLKVRWT